MEERLRVIDRLYPFTIEILERVVDGSSSDVLRSELKLIAVRVLLLFNRFHMKHERRDDLIEAIAMMDDLRVMLRLSVDTKVINIETYRDLDDRAQDMIKGMLSMVRY